MSEPGEEVGPGGGMLFSAPPEAEQERMVEAILFATAAPLTEAEIAARMPEGSDAGAALAALGRRYRGRGVNLARIGRRWALRTAPDLGFLMRREAEAPRRLSKAGIETLAIIAYHQPVTRAGIEEIRGVGVSRGTLDILLELGWIRLGPRRASPGRPVTFATTDAFLDHFGLESPRDLPGVRELREADRVAAEPEPDEGRDEDTGDMFDDDAART